jgi:hypothetical protein
VWSCISCFILMKNVKYRTWLANIVTVLSVFIPKLVLVMVLKFFLPRLHRKNMTSNHTFCCRRTGVFGFRATLQYICFRSSGSIGGVWSTLASPFLWKKNGTSYKLSALKSIRFGLSIHFSRELEIDIIHDPLFKRANEVFHAVTVDMKRKGLARWAVT